MATLAPQATCPLLDLQCSPDTFWGNKENALISLAISSGVQASFRSLCLCFVQWKATYQNNVFHVLPFKIVIHLCISITISNFRING